MQAKNLKIKVEEFSVIPIQIIHFYEIYNISSDINKIYRNIEIIYINKNSIAKHYHKNNYQICLLCFCHHLDLLWSQTLKKQKKR